MLAHINLRSIIITELTHYRKLYKIQEDVKEQYNIMKKDLIKKKEKIQHIKQKYAHAEREMELGDYEQKLHDDVQKLQDDIQKVNNIYESIDRIIEERKGHKNNDIPDVPPPPEIPKMPFFNKINDAVEMNEFKQLLQNLYEYAIKTDPIPNDPIFNKNVRSINRIRELYNVHNSPNLEKSDRDVLGKMLHTRARQYYTSQGLDVSTLRTLNDLSNANKVMRLQRYARRINEEGKHIKAIPSNFPKNKNK